MWQGESRAAALCCSDRLHQAWHVQSARGQSPCPMDARNTGQEPFVQLDWCMSVQDTLCMCACLVVLNSCLWANCDYVHSRGSVGIVLCPLLTGSGPGSSLRSDLRRIEDKLCQLHLEIRPFHLPVSLSNLHGNCEQPAAYNAFLVVCDHVLPSKGVNYRLVRSGHGKDTDSPPKVSKEQINVRPGLNF